MKSAVKSQLDKIYLIITCNSCTSKVEVSADSMKDAKASARSEGWLDLEGKDYCSDCIAGT